MRDNGLFWPGRPKLAGIHHCTTVYGRSGREVQTVYGRSVRSVYGGIQQGVRREYSPRTDEQVGHGAVRGPPSEPAVEGPFVASRLGDALARAQSGARKPTGTLATDT